MIELEDSVSVLYIIRLADRVITRMSRCTGIQFQNVITDTKEKPQTNETTYCWKKKKTSGSGETGRFW